MDLAAIPFRATRRPGVHVHFYATESKPPRVLALIRMAPGTGYPRHRHRAAEHVLVLQGAYDDERGRHEAGSFVTYEPLSEHSPVAAGTVAGPDCVLLALASEGVDLLE